MKPQPSPCPHPSSCLIPFPVLSPPPTSLPAHSLTPSLQHSCCLARSIYSGIFRVITIKLLKGDNPAKEARLTSSPLLSLAWCSPAPPFPEASCSHPASKTLFFLLPHLVPGREKGRGQDGQTASPGLVLPRALAASPAVLEPPVSLSLWGIVLRDKEKAHCRIRVCILVLQFSGCVWLSYSNLSQAQFPYL